MARFEKPVTLQGVSPPGDQVSVDEAQSLGAFSEDAICEQDALEAASDPRLSPAEALAKQRT
jgi:hypothetical protein